MPASPRVDAERNRARLLEVARETFTRAEVAADRVSLEGLAREAGVGIGTLYRHFPTREALVEAVYRTELQAVCDLAPALLDEHEPAEALRLWIAAYSEFVSTKRGMVEVLRGILLSGAIVAGDTRARVTDAMRTLLSAGVASGVFRDVDPGDVTASMVGVFLATPAAADAEQRGRMLDLLLAGVEARPAAHARPEAAKLVG